MTEVKGWGGYKLRLKERPALFILIAILGPLAIFHEFDFFRYDAFGLDLRVFRHAALLPISEIYQPSATAPFVYPPTGIALFKPLGLLSVTGSYLCWSLLSVSAFLYATRTIEYRIVILTIGSTVFIKTLLIGQSTILLGSLVLLACLKRGTVTGILLGIVGAIKPQLLVLAPLAFLVRRDWGVINGMGLGALGMLLLELALFGVQPWFDWIAALPAFRETLINGDLLWIMVNPAGVAENWGLPALPFLIFGICLGIAAVARAARHVEGIELAALITITSLISVPYAVAHDLLAALPFAAFVMFRDRFSASVLAAMLVMTLNFMAIGLVIFALAWLISPTNNLKLRHSAAA